MRACARVCVGMCGVYLWSSSELLKHTRTQENQVRASSVTSQRCLDSRSALLVIPEVSISLLPASEVIEVIVVVEIIEVIDSIDFGWSRV